MHAKILTTVSQAFILKRLLFNLAYRRGVDRTHSAADLAHPKPLDSLVWAKVRRNAGLDRVKLLITGGAPAPPRLMEFLRVLLPAQILQGYGLTETFALGAITFADDTHLGHVGLPLGVETRLEAVPDTAYTPTANPPCGELLLRGANVFCGYFRDVERTREAFMEGAEGGFNFILFLIKGL